MNISYLKDKNKSIAYNKHFAQKRKAPSIIFHHGFKSDMNGVKALFIEKFCKEKDYNFIRFDNFGCGRSSGAFTDQTITNWLEGAQYILDEITEGPVILVGSSLGAWIAFLSALENPSKVSGVVTVSAAFDFTEELIWNIMDDREKEELLKNKILAFTGTEENCSDSYPINIALIQDARKYLLLNKKEININCPVHLIHGMKDTDVPSSISRRAFDLITGKDTVLKIVKNGDHKLSTPQDLRLICNSIEEILSII